MCRDEEKEAGYETGSDAASPSSLAEDSNVSEAAKWLLSNYTKIHVECQERMLKCCLSLLAWIFSSETEGFYVDFSRSLVC